MTGTLKQAGLLAPCHPPPQRLRVQSFVTESFWPGSPLLTGHPAACTQPGWAAGRSVHHVAGHCQLCVAGAQRQAASARAAPQGAGEAELLQLPQQRLRALPLGTLPGLPARVLLPCQLPWAAVAANGAQLLPLRSGVPCPPHAPWEPKEIPEELEQGGTAGSPSSRWGIHWCQCWWPNGSELDLNQTAPNRPEPRAAALRQWQGSETRPGWGARGHPGGQRMHNPGLGEGHRPSTAQSWGRRAALKRETSLLPTATHSCSFPTSATVWPSPEISHQRGRVGGRGKAHANTQEPLQQRSTTAKEGKIENYFFSRQRRSKQLLKAASAFAHRNAIHS